MANDRHKKKIGILMGGGPAPGINAVIHAATIEAINNGFEVVGIYDGFKHLMEGELVSTPLTISDVSRIHHRGGSILRTARANPTTDEEYLKNCVRVLIDAEIGYLLAIGGDDTAYSAYRVSRYAREYAEVEIKTVHVPKTIDNDLPLPEGLRTFGFETARAVGTNFVNNLMEDARTTQRWFLVVAMGRKAGHLAIGIGKSSGATLTIIPEEWGDRTIRLQEVLDIMTTSLLRRLAVGKPYGLVILAEGLAEQMSETDLADLKEVERDEHGHIRLSEINFSEIIKHEWRKELAELGIKMRVISKDLGYELRCSDPIAYDIEYTRGLGAGAVEFLMSGGSHATVTVQNDRLVPIPFDQMMDPETGRTEVRRVRTDGFAYQSALKFMIRLTPQDADNHMLLAQMASHANLKLEEFRNRYGYLLGIAERPF